MSMEIYQAGPIKRYRATKAEVEERRAVSRRLMLQTGFSTWFAACLRLLLFPSTIASHAATTIAGPR
jgi:hypothetical protein